MSMCPPPACPCLWQLFDLSGSVAFITGGAQGIGAAIALGAAASGADVVLAGRHHIACVICDNTLGCLLCLGLINWTAV